MAFKLNSPDYLSNFFFLDQTNGLADDFFGKVYVVLFTQCVEQLFMTSYGIIHYSSSQEILGMEGGEVEVTSSINYGTPLQVDYSLDRL